MKIQKPAGHFEPITNSREFTDELIRHCSNNNKDLVIIHEGMEPVVKISFSNY
ncbi:hypothetical protein [[Clostridium] dakarense]|uniref:hypothetical protein n=1 Tax=Faecalimicrobium dakarense TaxID=1301100 RepID=UPI0004B86E5C|nr:hypothetical protein [[Clostridium] dakarense]